MLTHSAAGLQLAPRLAKLTEVLRVVKGCCGRSRKSRLSIIYLIWVIKFKLEHKTDSLFIFSCPIYSV